MAAISLRDYIREIEKMVEGGRNEEAIAHSRHVLESFPKHVDVYRLLGKAYLEGQRYGDAGDIFQRVLSAVPDDFVAHVGMSIIREDEGNLDEAIWHMERAFDVQPSNNAIQDELRRLYGRRDNVEPPKIRLTRGALARMYYKGELYPQAIAELRAALNENPDRLDLQLVLAETYARTGQRAEAVDLAGQVLRKLPFCRAANQIMVDMLIGTDQESEFQTYFQRLGQLDPYATYITAAVPRVEDVPDQAIRLNKLDYKVSQAVSGAPSQPLWAATLGVEVAEIATGQEESLPEWLASGPVMPVQEGELAESGAEPVPPGDEMQTAAQELVDMPGLAAEEEQIPDWMKELGWTQASEQIRAAEAAMPSMEEAGDLEVEGELAPAEIPEWLQEMAPSEIASEAKAEEDVSPWLDELFSSETQIEEEDQRAEFTFAETPSEITDQKGAGLVLGAAAVAAAALGQEDKEPADIEPPQVQAALPEEIIDEAVLADLSAEVAPDWLVEDQEVAFDESLQAPAVTAEEQLEEWMAESTPAEELPVGEISGEFTDWLEEGLELPAEQVGQMAQPELESTDRSLEEGALEKAALGEEALAEMVSEEPPEWMVESETVLVSEAFKEEAVGMEEELPAWLYEDEAALGELAPSEAAAEESKEPPRWLFEAAVEGEAETTDEGGAETGKETEGMPDWLKAAGAVAGTAGAFEVFEWLGEEEGVEEELSLVSGIEGLELGDTQPTRVKTAAEEPVVDRELEEAFAWLDSMLTPVETKPEVTEPQAPVEEMVETTEPQTLVEEMVEATEPQTPIEEMVEAIEMEAPVEVLPPTPPETPGDEMPIDDDAAFAWLESLAVRQGAQEALLLKPEERREAPPDWLKAAAAVEASDLLLDQIQEKKAEDEATLEQEVEATAMEGIPEEQEEGIETTVPAPPPAPVEETPELPDWLAEPTAGARDETLEWTPPPVARRKYDVNKITLAELERLPGIGFIMAQRVIEYRNTRGPFRKIDDLLNVPEFNALMLEGIRENLYLVTRPELAPATSPTPTRPRPETTSPSLVPSAGLPDEIGKARRYLLDGMLDEALGIYGGLIHSNQHLGLVVEDLKQASNQYPSEFFVLQSLGDAYLRSDQMSEAMQAFIRAEKLLLL